jgi:ribonuclease P/MRP protein subunit POP8
MSAEDTIMAEAPRSAQEQQQPNTKPRSRKGHEISTCTIAAPPFSYACLELVPEGTADSSIDALTVRTYMTAALTQFLGLAGAAIAVDILKVEGRECWVRMPREDLSPFIAALGGWVGGSRTEGRMGWRVKASGNWLSVLVTERGVGKVWDE